MKILMMIIAIAGSLAAFSFIYRIFSPMPEDQSSLAVLASGQKQDISSFARLDPNRGFFDRMHLFFSKSMGMEKRLEELHMLLGSPAKPDPLQILRYKEFTAVALPVFFYFMLGTPLAVITAPLGFFIPDMLFWAKIQKRQEDILRNFPTMVDLAALTIESGLDYMTAMDRIVKIAPKKTELELEIEKTINEVQLGYSRRDALRRLAMRTGLQEVRSFVGLIIQSDELGTSLVELLRNFSSDLRFRRLNRAEKLAAQASTKMLIPLFVFIFPTVFILMLAPMIVDLLRGGMPF